MAVVFSIVFIFPPGSFIREEVSPPPGAPVSLYNPSLHDFLYSWGSQENHSIFLP